jgi:hypothetical protein
VVLELLHEDKNTDKAKGTDTSVNFPFQMCQNDKLQKKNNISSIKYVAYKSCNVQNFMFQLLSFNTPKV